MKLERTHLRGLRSHLHFDLQFDLISLLAHLVLRSIYLHDKTLSLLSAPIHLCYSTLMGMLSGSQLPIGMYEGL
jgi:hypothetical protein